MTQYCRYCCHLIVCDACWCDHFERELSELSCKRPTRCGDFEYCEIDAFGTNTRGYRPRQSKPVSYADRNQIGLFDGGKENV